MPSPSPENSHEEAERIVNSTTPFGPLDATAIREPGIAGDLFDGNTVPQIKEDWSLLIGRSGSGKSAFLAALARDRQAALPAVLSSSIFILPLAADIEFPDMAARLALERIPDNAATAVQWMSSRWQDVLWLQLGRLIVQESDGSQQASEYYRFIYDSIAAHDFQDLESDVAHKYHQTRGEPNTALSSKTRKALSETIPKFLRSTRSGALITIDSMDEYDPYFQKMLRGMLRALVEINRSSPRLHIVACIPYETLLGIRNQLNVPKEFSTMLSIKWEARKLFELAAHRYRVFLKGLDARDSTRLRTLELTSKEGLWEFWNTVLPSTLTNDEGRTESTTLYIARRTQLLPRQLLWMLNGIAAKAETRRDHNIPFSIEDIRLTLDAPEGQDGSERSVAAQVFTNFQGIYPTSRKACEFMLSGLPPVVTHSNLQRRWHKREKSLAKLNFPQFEDFCEMAVELGVLGKLSRDKRKTERTEQYVFAHFRYVSEDSVDFDTTDDFVVHPLFHKILHISSGVGNRTICPLGSDLDLGD